MASLGSLVIELAANTARMQSDLGRAVNIAQGAATRMTNAFRTVSGILGAGGLSLTASAVFQKFIQNSSEAQASMLKLEGAVRRAGAASQVTVAQISDLANGVQKSSRFSDEAVKNAAATLLRFDKVTGETFTRALRISADLAEVMGTDVTEAASQLGKALQLPGEGLRVLTAAGIKFNDEQIKTLQYMTENGQAMEAQNIILDELAKRTSGAAAEGVKTLGGAFSQLANVVGELAEVPQTIDRITKAINALSEKLSNSKVAENLGGLAKAMRAVMFPGAAIGGLLTDQLFSGSGSAGPASFGALRVAEKDPSVGGYTTKDPLAAATAARLAAEELTELQKGISEDAIRMAEETSKAISKSLEDSWQEQQKSAEEQANLYQQMLEDWTQWEEEAAARISNYTDEMTERARFASETMQSYFVEFLFDPFDRGLKGMLNGFVDTIRRMVAEAAASKLFGSTASGGAGLGDIITSGLGKFGKGLLGFANGGSYSGRSPFIVGEHGPEIVVPNGGGSVIPNHKLGGSPVINVNIDARGSDEGSVAKLRSMIPMIVQQAVQLSRVAVRDDVSRGALRNV